MKNARQEEILKLITAFEIETQEELASRLNRAGYAVTQATVSRDIRELKLRKTQGGSGRLCYTARDENAENLKERYQRVLRDAFVSMEFSINIMVMHTVSGMAMAAAAALDSLGWDELLGCIAGDDTVMAVLRSPEEADTIRKRIETITEG
ncbi:MAG: arginine repressor [Lachnospiraceae bacterium]|nr:arginine repressor [Lachnospiraceae bacterium]